MTFLWRILALVTCGWCRSGLVVVTFGSAIWSQSSEVPASQQPKPPAERPAEEAKPVEEPAEAKSPGAAPVDPKTYIIGNEDVLSVRVWREPELSGFYTVRPDGKISMPLAGEVDAAGKTPDGFKDNVLKALSEFMNRPEVTVEVSRVNSKRYFISGEVNRPGSYALVTPVTILEALSNAGGLREFANRKKIVVMRGQERIKFNYAEVIKGKNMEQNIALQPGDHIIIP